MIIFHGTDNKLFAHKHNMIIIIIELIYVINSVRTQAVLNQVKVRNIDDANGAEFYTLDTVKNKFFISKFLNKK